VRWFRSAGRRRTFALATSVAVHAAALLLLLGPAAPPPVPPDAEPIAVEFIDSPPAPAVAPPEPSTPSAPGSGPAPPRRRPPAAPSGPRGGATAEATPEPGGTLGMRFPPASLLLDHDAVDRLTRDGVIDGPQLPPGLPTKRPRGPGFSQRLAARVRDDAARDNVERGKVHPQAYDYMRGAQRLFRPDPEVMYRDQRAPNTVGRSLKLWAKGAYNMVRPWQTVEELDRTRWARDPHRQGPDDMFKAHNGWIKGTEQAAQPMACLICLVIRPGETPRIELAASSGNKEVDRAAVEALERTAERRPTDPDVRNQRSCYRFTVTIIRIPPVPIVGCNFDEAALKASCYYPTKKVTRTDVKLESVDYDG
jgi:hypothetical protein